MTPIETIMFLGIGGIAFLGIAIYYSYFKKDTSLKSFETTVGLGNQPKEHKKLWVFMGLQGKNDRTPLSWWGIPLNRKTSHIGHHIEFATNLGKKILIVKEDDYRPIGDSITHATNSGGIVATRVDFNNLPFDWDFSKVEDLSDITLQRMEYEIREKVLKEKEFGKRLGAGDKQEFFGKRTIEIPEGTEIE